MSLDAHLASTSATFQAYVRRGLARVAERRESRPGAALARSPETVLLPSAAISILATMTHVH